MKKEVLYKRSVLKNFSKLTDKHKKQSSGGILSNDILKNFAKFSEKLLCRSLFFNKVAGWNIEIVTSSHEKWSVQKLALRNFANFTGRYLR